MRRLRHVGDRLICGAGNISWPISDTQTVVEFRAGSGSGWDIQFEGATPDQASFLNIPIDPNVDYCLLSFNGKVQSQSLKAALGAPTFEPAHVPFGLEGYLHGWAWGYPRSTANQYPEGGSGPTTKADAWASQAMALVCQNLNVNPPFFGYSENGLNSAVVQSRLTNQGFPLNTTAGVGYNTAVGDRFSVMMPVGRACNGRLSVSGLRHLLVRFVATQPTFDFGFGYDPGQDYWRTSLILTAHYFEATERDPY